MKKIKVSQNSKNKFNDAKNEYKAAKAKRDKIRGKLSIGKIVGLFKRFTVRLIEVFADMMVGFIFLVGIGANVLPYLAVTLASDAGVPELISAMADKDAASITNSIATLFAIWGCPMIFITVGLGIVCMKLLMLCVKKIHNGCNKILAPKSDADSDESADE